VDLCFADVLWDADGDAASVEVDVDGHVELIAPLMSATIDCWDRSYHHQNIVS
jgi:hypothetical protein